MKTPAMATADIRSGKTSFLRNQTFRLCSST